MLDAGIDVFSTLNVQHLECLNDRIAELTGIRVRETIPDDVHRRGRRSRADRHHPRGAARAPARRQGLPARRIETALNNFFRVENLAALREVALRQVAEEVEDKRLTTEHVGSREERLSDRGPQAVGERLLALIEPYPGAQRLVRRAWRSAQRLGAELELLWVSPRRGIRRGPAGARSALRQLASVLGTRLYVEESDDSPAAVADVAKKHGTTYILMGAPKPRAGSGGCGRRSAAADGAASRRGRADGRRPCKREPSDVPGSRPPRRDRGGGKHMSTGAAAIAVAAARGRVACGLPAADSRRLQARRDQSQPVSAILLPFTGSLSRGAHSRPRYGWRRPRAPRPDAGVSRAGAQNLPLSPRSRHNADGMPLLEVIEQRAEAQGVPVDSRVARGRTPRDALRRLLEARTSTGSSSPPDRARTSRRA